MSHTIVVIGSTGSKQVYIDVPIEEAVERFKLRERIGEYDSIHAFTIEDEFAAYDAYPLLWEVNDIPIPEHILQEFK
jgi:hypothetical protein